MELLQASDSWNLTLPHRRFSEWSATLSHDQQTISKPFSFMCVLPLAPYNDESSQLSDTIYGAYPNLKKQNSWGWRKSSVVKIVYRSERGLGSVPSTHMAQLQLQDHPNPSSDFLGHLHSCIHSLLLPWHLCVILIEEMELLIAVIPCDGLWKRQMPTGSCVGKRSLAIAVISEGL